MATSTSSEAHSLPDTPAQKPYQPRYIDIGINLADPIFRGVHNGKQRHPDDLAAVVDRARTVGCRKLIVTGSSFRSSRDALKLADEFPGTVYATAGIHPCSSAIFGTAHPHHHEADDAEHTAACDPDPAKPPTPDDASLPDAEKTASIIADLGALIRTAGPHRLVALGEFGLDYDRLHYCPAPLQRHSFAAQLSLAVALQRDEGLSLPLFLHSRAAHRDFVAALQAAFGPRLEGLTAGGVVHSFTGTAEEMRELMDLGLYIGINGCSFKSVENCEVVRNVMLDRLMIETDGPWCEVRPSHEGWRYLVEDAKREAREEEERAAAAAAARAEEERIAAAAAAAVAEVEAANGASETGTSTPTTDTPADGETPRPRRRYVKQPQQSQPKKAQSKASEVPERFRSVKKEKWEEGCMVKSRNEPCMIERVVKIVAGIRGVSVEEVAEAAWANTVKVFRVDD